MSRAPHSCIVKGCRSRVWHVDVERVKPPSVGAVFRMCFKHWTRYALQMVTHGWVVAEERSTYDDPKPRPRNRPSNREKATA